MFVYRAGAAALALAALAATTLSACSQPNLPSCGTVVQTSAKAADIPNAKFPLYPVHIAPALGVRPVSIYDVNRKDTLGYPVGETVLDTFMPVGTYILYGSTLTGDKCKTAFEVM